jgi:hypothetical protein
MEKGIDLVHFRLISIGGLWRWVCVREHVVRYAVRRASTSAKRHARGKGSSKSRSQIHDGRARAAGRAESNVRATMLSLNNRTGGVSRLIKDFPTAKPSDRSWRRVGRAVLVLLFACVASPSVAGLLSGSVTPKDVKELDVYDQSSVRVATVPVQANGYYQISLPAGLYTVRALSGGKNVTTRILIRNQPSSQDILFNKQ